jgi:hypothetical protein
MKDNDLDLGDVQIIDPREGTVRLKNMRSIYIANASAGALPYLSPES